VVVDGAHNVQGIEGLASTLDNEFPDAKWQIVAGMRGRRAPGEVLEPLSSLAAHLWATAPDDPGAIQPERIASSAGSTLGCGTTVIDGVPDAVAAAMEAAGSDGSVVVTGSLYVAGEARAALIGTEFRPSGVHVRFEAGPEDETEWNDARWTEAGDAWTEGGDEG
jgi:dihydrofolate synthase/folylpolyglutamate synthase